MHPIDLIPQKAPSTQVKNVLKSDPSEPDVEEFLDVLGSGENPPSGDLEAPISISLSSSTFRTPPGLIEVVEPDVGTTRDSLLTEIDPHASQGDAESVVVPEDGPVGLIDPKSIPNKPVDVQSPNDVKIPSVVTSISAIDQVTGKTNVPAVEVPKVAAQDTSRIVTEDAVRLVKDQKINLASQRVLPEATETPKLRNVAETGICLLYTSPSPRD